MIVVTGGCGFIGSNIIKALNNRGISDILVVDDLREGIKFKNIADCDVWDYMDKDDFLQKIKSGENFIDKITAIFHEGACSATTEWDGQYIMRNNYEYSKDLLHYCMDNNAAFLYASSASVYGMGRKFEEKRENEEPLNVYAYSKFQFDQYVRRILPNATNQIVGFRYFNVYGPREQHKGMMSSMAHHFNNQIKETGVAKIFEACEQYDNGEQRRDFIYIDDAVDVNLWFLDHPEKSGLFNLGTGKTHSFNELANAVIRWHGKGKIEYIPFPEKLKGRYQSFTQANIKALRQAGYSNAFKSVKEGVDLYLNCLNASSKDELSVSLRNAL